MPRFWREIALSASFRQETACLTACLKTKNITKLKKTTNKVKAKTKLYKYNNGEKILSQDGIILLAKEENSGFLVLSTIQKEESFLLKLIKRAFMFSNSIY